MLQYIKSAPDFIYLVIFFLPLSIFSQQLKDSPESTHYKTVIAGEQYEKSGFHQLLWGAHYRKEWTTPVKVKMINLDTVAGGLVATQQGGGRQTKTLRLRGANGKEYVLRSIAKDFKAALPEVFHETFAEKIIKDQVSFAHPYAPVTVPVMAEAAGIYHTNPEIVIVPDNPARLGEYNSVFANMLCLFEERADDNQEDASNFGNSKNVVGTEKMLEKVFADNDNRVDQLAFLRARLFDMFLGDWGRHEDQWRWASFEDGKKKTYKPIPRDRDQAYTKFDGIIPSIAVSYPQLDQLQTFSYNVRDIKKYNLPARYLDRQFINEPSKEAWVNLAKELQQALTDNIIETSVRRLPPELFEISGQEIINKLKSRRNHLVDIATEYYAFLTKEVEIVGTNDRELFQVKRINDQSTAVQVYKITNKGVTNNEPFYSRTFFTNETDEIRLYGLNEKDIFNIDGNANKGIRIKIMGGEGIDSINDRSVVEKSRKKTAVYDTKDNYVSTTAATKLHISDDTLLNNYNYKAFEYDIKGLYFKPFIGAQYIFRKEKWRKDPFAFEHSISATYSLFKNAFHLDYQGLYPQLFGKWGLILNANLAAPNVENYFGIGNETSLTTKSTGFNRVRSTEILGGIGVTRKLGKVHHFAVQAYYQSVSLRANKGKFVSEPFADIDPSVFDRKHFAIAKASYNLRNVNDEMLPTKGIDFQASAAYSKNLKDKNRSLMRYASSAAGYVPISKKFSFATRIGGATNEGETEFYQFNKLGGSTNLRGYRHQRFYGKTMFYNNNELRWITPTKNFFFNGKIGLLAFLDNGRVWEPGESSDEWHTGYGGGIMLVPFNKLVISGVYACSKENNLVDARIGVFF